MDQEKFEYYKKEIERLVGYENERPVLQFASIDWQCKFWREDPVELAVALMKEGYQILFDEGDFSQERERLQAVVEARFREELAEEGLDLIDRQALLQEIKRGKGNAFCTSWRETAEWMEACIQGAARADAKQVVHGHWVVDDTGAGAYSGDGYIVFRCSECNEPYAICEREYGWSYGEKIPFNYCHKCGVKMDLNSDINEEAEKGMNG